MSSPFFPHAAPGLRLFGHPASAPRSLSARELDLVAAGGSDVSLSLTTINSKAEVDRIYRK